MAVTSLSAYIFLSAGVKFPDCPITATPMDFTCSINSAGLRVVLKPGMASNLSIVPPVNPSPLPLIFATGTPNAAAIGATINVVLSPTPPVECLSTFIPEISDKSTVSPEYLIRPVSSAVSVSVSF